MLNDGGRQLTYITLSMDNPKNNQTTMNTPETNKNPAASDLSSAAGSARRRSGVLPLAVAVMAASGGAWDIGPAMGFARNRHSSYAERHDPNREKTAEDLERMEAARLKRERKAAKKLSLQNNK